jgi:2'-5' RNA ligase
MPLWAFGSRVLGYDAATGRDVLGFAPPGLDPADWRRATDRPRVYGFHATLKAPFRLAAERSERDLLRELDAFRRGRSGFDLGPLGVEALPGGDGGFVALTSKRPSTALASLEHDTVRAFGAFRSPMSEVELSRRRPESLTTRQRDSLLNHGYPFVGADYRFHMTLSGAVGDVADVADRLADCMANQIGTAHLQVDALVLYVQPDDGARFSIAERFALRPDVSASSLAPA